MNFLTLSLAPLLLSLLSSTACTKQDMKARDLASSGKLVPKITMTATFKSLADLPRCDTGSEQMSAYISERDVFVKCRSYFWRDVKPGDTNGSYVAGNTVRFHEWTDSSTRLRWSLPKQGEVALASVNSGICSSGWKLPTREELALASGNGLFEGLKSRGGVAFDRAWTASFDAITGVSKGNLAEVLPKSDQLTAGVYCVASLN